MRMTDEEFDACLDAGLAACDAIIASFAPRTPPAENSNPSGASDGADGQGVCAPKRSNLDSTRRRAVKKGCVVQFPGGATARVARVRMGLFWADVPIPSGMPSHLCMCVRVVSD